MKVDELVILVGGKGTRLGKITKRIPKPLIKIGNRTFLDQLLSKIIRYNFKKIYLLCSYQKRKFFKKYHKSILDVGCGEGYLLKFFDKLNYKCHGVDYSTYGIKNQNPKLLKKIEFINCDVVEDNYFMNKQFDIIFLMNIAEHVPNFTFFIKKIYKKLKKNGLLFIKIPNEYDIIHNKFLKNNNLKKEQLGIFSPKHHLNYFNKTSLEKSLINNVNVNLITMYSDFPIEMFILNKFTNFYKNKTFGKHAHDLRVKITNLIQERNQLTKILDYYQLSLQLGLGRSITAVFKK